MKSVILTRVSSISQEDGVSLDAQQAKLLEYANERQLEVINFFRLIESSTKGERKQFHEALAFIRKQPTRTVLLVHSIDRILRGFKEYPIIEELINSNKLEIHTYNEKLILNKNTPWSEYLQFDFSVLAGKMYVAQQRQHINKAIDYKLKKGEILGKVPLGYLNYREAGHNQATVILDEDRAFLVKRLFQEYGTGVYSIAEIARMAEKWHLTSRRSGKPLSLAAIAKMLRNPFYVGEYRYRGQNVPHIYTKLIDSELYHRCQRILEKSSRQKGSLKPVIQQRTQKPYVFRGLMHCAHCGCQIISDTKKGRYTYLCCSKRKGKDICQGGRIREEEALAVVERILERIQVPDSLIMQIQERLKSQYNSQRQELRQLKTTLRKSFDEVEKSLDLLVDLYTSGRITQDEYDKKRQHSLKKRDGITQQLASYSEDDTEFRDSFITLLRLVSQASRLFKSSNVVQKRKIISLVCSNLSLKGKKVGYELNRPFDKLIALRDNKVWWSIGDSNS